jgi:PhnB protein
MVNYKPAGYHAVTPYLTVQGVNKLIDFLKGAFNATEVKACHTTDDGTIMHAEVLVGDSWLMMGEANEQHKARPTNLYFYVPNVDEVYKQAIKAGGKSISEPADMFYGDRHGAVTDPVGNSWWIATHIEDVSPEEMKKRATAQHKQPVAAK